MVPRRYFVAVVLSCLLSCNAGFGDLEIGGHDFELPPPVGIVCDELAEAIEEAKVVLYYTLHIDFDCPTAPPSPSTTAPPPPPTTQPPPPPTTQPPPPPTTQPPPPPTTQPPPTPTTQPPPPPTTQPPPPPTTQPPPPPTTTEIIDSSFSSLSSFQPDGPLSVASDNDGEFIGGGDECFTRPDAADYRGVVSQTCSGKTCRRWDSEGVDPFYSELFGDDANYCRNTAERSTDGGKRWTAWCYVDGPAGSWEYCDVGEFQDKCEPDHSPDDVGEYVCDGTNPECYEDRFGSDYLGHVSVTVNGRTCQMWNIDYPHKRKNKYKPSSDSLRFGDHNYCRNSGYQKDGQQISNRRQPWCYTTDPDVLWEYCDVGLPCDTCQGRDFDENEETLYEGSYPECYLRNDASDYRGFVNHTRSGLPCQRWLQQFPHPVAKGNVMLFGHHDNYCRIRRHAYRKGKKPFCFTTDPEVEWEYCEVGDRHEVCINEHLKPVAPYVGYRPECYMEKDGQDYRGFISTTVSGITCEFWRDRPNNKKYYKAFKEEENYCRTLGIEAGPGRGKPWCFVVGHPTQDWDYCDVGPRYRHCVEEYV
ncbi:plasminogen-like [Patiria miniata]|uniref:Kringle domain-containing protein n=1 Tax=Patiria miniata TaxID=46514 RepID=A0A913ZX99_PATMI|nr:plasminogen-like [Patiria miniata]